MSEPPATSSTPAPEPSPPPRTPFRPRRRWLRRLLLAAVLLPTLLVIGLLELPYLLPDDLLRNEAVRAITEALAVPAEIESVRFDPLTGLVVEGIRIGPPEGFERDVFSAKRLVVDYTLTGALRGEIRISELSLDAPTVVLETRNGITNVEAILAQFKQGPTPQAGPQAVPTVGPLLPVDVILDDLTVGPFEFETAGEGPQLRASQLWLHAGGEAGREKLDIEASLQTKEDPRGNLAVRLPPADGTESIRVSGDMGLDFQLRILADTDRGLAIRDLVVDFGLRPRLQVELGPKALPEVRLDLHAQLHAEPPKDEITVGPLRLSMDDAPVLDAGARLVGIRAALEAELGKFGAVALSETVGLIDGAEVPELTVNVSLLALPLDKVSVFAALFEPDAELSGLLGVKDLKLVGTPKQLQSGLPDEAMGRIAFDAVKAKLPARALNITGIDGALGLRRDESEPVFRLDGDFELGAASVPGLRVSGGSIGIHGHVPRLGVPLAGAASVGFEVALDDLQTPSAGLRRLVFSSSVSGADLMSAKREATPIIVQAQLQTEGIVARTATLTPYRVPAMALSVRAELDHLVVPAQGPIMVQVDLQVPRMSGPQRVQAKGLVLTSQISVDDPRRGFPTPLTTKTSVRAQRLAQGPLTLKRAHLQLDTQSPGEAQMGTGALSGIKLPIWVTAQVALGAEQLLGDQEIAGLDTPVSLVGKVRARPALGQVKLSELVFELGRALRIQGAMSVKKGLSASPFARVDLQMPHARLGPLLDLVPTGMKAGYEDAQAQGELKGSLRFLGHPAELGQNLDLRASEAEVEVGLGFDDVGVSSVSKRFAMVNLNGGSSVKLGPSGFTVGNRMNAGRIDVGAGAARRSIVSTALLQDLGYEDGQWRIVSTIEASKVLGATGGDDVAGLSSEVVLHYSVNGDLEVPRFTLSAASAGVDAQLRGRLSRGLYGVLSPELEGQGWVDFDRLVAVLPSIGDLKGRLSSDFSVRAQGQTEVEVQGALSMSDFGYKDNVSNIEGAFGRLPLQQMLTLPPPAFDPAVAGAVGSLGDDLEARLEELQARFQKVKGLFSTEDVILVPPRHADHVALGPYRARAGARLTAKRVTYGRYDLEAVVAQAHWRAGVLRLDHFEAALWDGDLLYDMALQLTPDLDVRAHIRGTFTNLNLDIPYAMATGGTPDTEGAEKYQTSATMDLSFGLKERTLNGRIEITKLSQPLVERLFGGLSLSGGGGAVQALAMSERVGVRPVAAKVWISQNLLNVQFEWSRLWLHVYYPEPLSIWLLFDTAFIFLRPILIPTLGGLYVIPTVNGTVHRLSLSSFIDDALTAQQPEQRLQALTPYVAAAPE